MKRPWNILLYILLGAVGIWLCAVLILPVGLPFLLGYVLSRLSLRFRPRKWNETLAGIFGVSVVFLLLSILLWLLFRFLLAEGQALARRLPALLEELSPTLTLLQQKLLALTERLPDGLAQSATQWVERLFTGGSLLIGSLSEWLLTGAAGLLSRIPNLILFILTTLLSAYFFATDPQSVESFLKKHIPHSPLEKGTALLHRLKRAIGGYVKSQLYLSAVSFGLCALGLLILGYPRAFLWAVLIGLVDALPVFGTGIILIPWGLLSFLRGDTTVGVGLLLLYGGISVTRTILEPRFLGKQIGLHPLLTLLSLYGGFRLFGVPGMVLLPIGVMMLKQVYDLSLDF